MERLAMEALRQWKDSSLRKPLIIQGARQVGKTWLMKQFGAQTYEQVVYLNFESNPRLRGLFVPDYDINRILTSIEVELGLKIDPSKCLLIWDEVQEAERGLTALKYFYEQAPHIHIMAAGSLLGISMQKQHSFPVGKVDFIQLNPLSFHEFLLALGEKQLVELLQQQQWSTIALFHDKLVELLRLYYFVGGMPEVVGSYVEEQDLTQIRSLQSNILLGYEHDFAKHAPSEIVPRIRMVWHSILSQLAKENRKYIYGQVNKGSRAKDFEAAINWLADAGLVIKVNRVHKGSIPLNAYADYDAFKLFFLDVGLLSALGQVPPQYLLEKNRMMLEFKGALTEQYVLQALKSTPNSELFYWSSEATAELDFVFQQGTNVIPLEVKAEENLKAKSLKSFVDKFSVPKAWRCSMSPFRDEGWLVNIPLYGISFFREQKQAD
jgi:predicted AAA+ superfamily ATPase